MNTRDDLQEAFGDYLSQKNDAEWDHAKAAFPPGTTVTGKVVLLCIFGIFVDIGAGFPALLSITQFNPSPKRRPVVVEDYPEVGTVIKCRVVSFGRDNRQIGLTQVSLHPTLDRLPEA
jgi:ribosomal protein S1